MAVVTCPVGTLEFVKRPAWNLYNDVIDGRLKRRRSAPCNSVCYFVQPKADGNFCGDPRDGIPGCLGCEGRRTGYAGIDLDNSVISVFISKLDITSTRTISARQILMAALRTASGFIVLEVSGSVPKPHSLCVNTHRVHVFHTTDNNAGIGRVAHDFKLDLFPASDTLPMSTW